jgi:hypothetical protein
VWECSADAMNCRGDAAPHSFSNDKDVEHPKQDNDLISISEAFIFSGEHCHENVFGGHRLVMVERGMGG